MNACSIRSDYFFIINKFFNTIAPLVHRTNYKMLKYTLRLCSWMNKTTFVPPISFTRPPPPKVETPQKVYYVVVINSTKNNTLLTLSLNNRLLCKSTAGLVGLKKTNRKTSDAGYNAAKLLATKSDLRDIAVHLIFKGFGRGR